MKTSEKHDPYVLSKFRVNFIDAHLMQNNPKLNTEIVNQIFKTRKPSQQEILNSTREEVKKYLDSKLGSTAESTAEE